MIAAGNQFVGWGTGGATGESANQTALVAEVNAAGTTGTNRGSGVTPTSSTTTVSNDTINVTQTLSATATINISECGIFTASSAGTMILRHVFTALQVVNTGSIQFQLSYQKASS